MCLPGKPNSISLGQGGAIRGFGAPKSQTLIVPSIDPDTIFVPSGEKTTEMMATLWALVFSATQLMSIAIILRTKEKKRGL